MKAENECKVRRCARPAIYAVVLVTDKGRIEGNFCLKHAPEVGPKTRFADFRGLISISAEELMASMEARP